MATVEGDDSGGVVRGLLRWMVGDDMQQPRSMSRSQPHAALHPQSRPEPGAMLMATVDSLAEPHQILGLVDAAMGAASGIVPTARLMHLLADQAASIGADAVIGIRLSQLTIPGASRVGWFGRVIEHRANTVVAVAIGTAVRWRPAHVPCATRPRTAR